MKYIVINKCYGGFGLSHEAVMLYAEKKGISLYPVIDDICKKIYKEKAILSNPDVMVHYYKVEPNKYETLKKECEEIGKGYKKLNNLDWYFSDSDIERDDETLIEIIKEIGERANGRYAKLNIVEIPDDVKWVISEYDGYESVEESHRSWS